MKKLLGLNINDIMIKIRTKYIGTYFEAYIIEEINDYLIVRI